jgi:hypothetical protein
MAKKKFDHAEHLVAHAATRARERYRFKPTPRDYETIINQIVQKQATLVEDQILKGVYDVTVRKQRVRVVYHYVKRKIVTFLPLPFTKEWHKHRANTRGSIFWQGQPPLIPLDTDFIPPRDYRWHL